VTPKSGETIRVLIVDDIPETRENLRKLLSFDPGIEVVGAAGSGAAGIEMAQQYEPHVVLMDINMPGMDGITATQKLLQEMPATQVIMLSVQGESDYLRRAMMAGARDFLTKPPGGDELMSTIRRVYEMGKQHAARIAPPQPQVSRVEKQKREGPHGMGQVVAVFSPKGGVGVTTVTVNVAIALQQLAESGQKIAVMDADLQFGDVGVMLNLQPTRSIVDLVPQIEDVDEDMLNSVMTAHGSGIKVMLAPPQPEAAEALLSGPAADEGGGGNAALRKILGLMRQEFDVILVDMWSWLDEVALTMFDTSTLILLVIKPDIPSIKSARLFLEVASKLNYPMENIMLVVNGADRRAGIRIEQIEKALLPVRSEIPLDEQAAISAANHGVPFYVRDRSRPASQAILELAEAVLEFLNQEPEEDEEEENKEPSGTGRLRLSRIFG
jgi:pilus assembly protein CpaE